MQDQSAAETGYAVDTLKEEYRKLLASPFVDHRFVNDNLNLGVRLDRRQYGYVLPNTPIKTVVGEASRGGFYFDKLMLPNPPGLPILALWDEMSRALNDAAFVNAWPFLTWSQYQTIWQWLNGVMPMDGDETYWHDIATANPHMIDHLDRMVAILSTFNAIARTYWDIAHRFLKKPREMMTVEEWKWQDRIKLIGNQNEYEATLQDITRFFLRPEQYVIPTEQEFGLVVDANNNHNHYAPILWFASRTQPMYWLLMVYIKIYPNYYNVAQQGRRALVLLIGDALAQQWVYLIGADPFLNKNYKMLQEKWPRKIPIQQLETVLVTVNETYNKVGRFLPPPSDPTVEVMHQMEMLMIMGNKAALKIDWVITAHEFFKRRNIQPTANAYDIAQLVKDLRDPMSHEIASITFVQIMQRFEEYVKLMKIETKDWTLARNVWEWNSSLQNKVEAETQTASGYDPNTVRKAKDKWGDPSLLSREECEQFLREAYPKGKFNRRKLPGETQTRYDWLVKQQDVQYEAWIDGVSHRSKQLAKFPVGSYQSVVDQDGKKQTVYNMYPDLGMWTEHQQTAWEGFVEDLLNPYRALTGEGFEEAVMRRLQWILTKVFEILDKASETATGFLQNAFIPIIGIGALAIFGIREVGNTAMKLK